MVCTVHIGTLKIIIVLNVKHLTKQQHGVKFNSGYFKYLMLFTSTYVCLRFIRHFLIYYGCKSAYIPI